MTESLNKVVDNMAQAIDKVQGTLTNHCKSIEEKVSSLTIESVTMDTSGSPGTGESDAPRDMDPHAKTNDVFGVLKEIEDRNRRKQNFLIYNLPEPTGSSRAGVDTKTVESIVQKNLSISGAKINKVTRLGKQRKESSRPLLVSMSDEASKWLCLKHAPKLRNDTKFRNVYLSPDLTLKEREASKKLYLELKGRRERGEKDLVIKHGKIVKRTSSGNEQNSSNSTTETTSHQ